MERRKIIIMLLVMCIAFGMMSINTSAKSKWKECDGTFKITCYWPGEDSWGYQTATGVTSRHRETCAVDPDVIPLGSEIKVVFKDGTTRYYDAVDTGSAVIGNVVDVFFDYYNNQCWYGAKVYIKKEK